MRKCLLHDPPIDVDDRRFGEHIDTHSDSELARWPGGLRALEAQVIASALETTPRSTRR